MAAVLALVCAAYYAGAGETAALAGFAVCSAYAIQFRPESILVLPVAGTSDHGLGCEWSSRGRVAGDRLLFLALASVHIAHLFAVSTSIGERARHGSPSRMFVTTCASTDGSISPTSVSRRRSRCSRSSASRRPAFARERLAMALYFALYFGIDLVFYAGSYNYGADVRYSLLTYPPIAVFAGLGAARAYPSPDPLGLPRAP
jgi:hypothetical protein